MGMKEIIDAFERLTPDQWDPLDPVAYGRATIALLKKWREEETGFYPWLDDDGHLRNLADLGEVTKYEPRLDEETGQVIIDAKVRLPNTMERFTIRIGDAGILDLEEE